MMHRAACVASVLVLAAGFTAHAATPPQLVAEVVSVDTTANTLTVHRVLIPAQPDVRGLGTVTLVVDAEAMKALTRFHAGDQIAITCRAAGSPTVADVPALCPAVVGASLPTVAELRAMSAAATPTLATPPAAPGRQFAAEIVATDASTGTVMVKPERTPGDAKIANAAGSPALLAVRGKALASLTSVKPGDRVTITCAAAAPDDARPHAASDRCPTAIEMTKTAAKP